MVHAIPVTVPQAAWRPAEVHDPATGETRTETHAVWRLEARTDDGDWRVVNAGGIVLGSVEIVRGRFHGDETTFRVLWVPEGGGGFLAGEEGALSGRAGSRRLGGTR